MNTTRDADSIGVRENLDCGYTEQVSDKWCHSYLETLWTSHPVPKTLKLGCAVLRLEEVLISQVTAM